MTTWREDIPHIDRLQWPILTMHSAEFGDEMWHFAPILRADVAADPAYRDMVRQALDYVITRGTSPHEWFDATNTWFFDQQELDEYLQAFRDYLFGDRPEPIYPPDNERVRSADSMPAVDDDSEGTR
ncbi:hypothetical protein [Nocardia huaxiensis]|uniref:Uncharacterized protein n=1 Tax=Nocardia huaxiensis TaxID=2755382 RepID=A0A7D6VC33_9NOCA|nr:hypothetical protein [Nocardia huaxiensis]QLY32841.1 hypothetical protein H0264_11855 [Nocardia huaxiensis]UFS93405.1 hypothetical protein LPY97_21490 [Nocardia huaxiensis]